MATIPRLTGLVSILLFWLQIAASNIILTHNGSGYKIKFKGRRMQTPKGVRYNSFRGIPYAQPPIGDLRFRDPKPIDYEGMAYVNATEYSMPCSQIDLTKTDELKVGYSV